MAAYLTNPVLPGFHPDPCLCRAGNDLYLATSTFEWFPGVCVYHSRDFRNWRLCARPLDRRSLLDLAGVPCSGGVWAPALSWHDGYFWLVYTNMQHFAGSFKDARNYLICAPTIHGPWTEPVFLHASGFDPSLFHDADGKKYVVSQRWNPFKENPFDGILIQEYDAHAHSLLGEPRLLFAGTELGVTEGPHLFRHRDWYFLVCAEGGTGWNHAVTVARCRSLEGQWEVHPENPVLTSADDPEQPLQKAGHASFLQLPSGEWYLAHLCCRPLRAGKKRFCPLGRETAVQRIEWGDDDWPRLAQGGRHPQVSVPAPELPYEEAEEIPERRSFAGDRLPGEFHSLRVPASADWASLHHRNGWVRLFGGQSLCSPFRQSLLARRIQHFECHCATLMEFRPRDLFTAAGLLLYYNLRNWACLQVTTLDGKSAALRLLHCENSHSPSVLAEEPLPGRKARLELRLLIAGGEVRFSSASPDEEDPPREIGAALPFAHFSDDFVDGWGFTGVFAGICCQDLAGHRHPADFKWFDYCHS
jgi:xylan 1,4-beta-xylosidase